MDSDRVPTVAAEPKITKPLVGPPKKAPPGKARKVRVYPTPEQRIILAVWFGAARWTYNQTIEWMRGQPQGSTISIKGIRDHCVSVEKLKREGRTVLLGVPYDVRDDGARDALKARASNLAQCKKSKLRGKAAHKFELKFRSRKARQESISIHSKHWSHARGTYGNLFGCGWKNVSTSEPLPEKLKYDARLIRTKLGEYYLCIPAPLEPRGESQAPDPALDSVVSLDPGVRTFMTAYSPDGQVLEWGAGDTTRIHRLCISLDKLQTRWKAPGVLHRKRYRLKRAGLRIQKKIRCIVDELQCKLAKWLCEEFRVVLIPIFETKKMIRRGHRRLSSKTARAMCTWAHYRFRMRLHDKAREYPWCRVIDTTEEFTSKTYGGCGELDHKLGGKKRYLCKVCGFDADRDHNGARNILIRHLSVNMK